MRSLELAHYGLPHCAAKVRSSLRSVAAARPRRRRARRAAPAARGVIDDTCGAAGRGLDRRGHVERGEQRGAERSERRDEWRLRARARRLVQQGPRRLVVRARELKRGVLVDEQALLLVLLILLILLRPLLALIRAVVDACAKGDPRRLRALPARGRRRRCAAGRRQRRPRTRRAVAAPPSAAAACPAARAPRTRHGAPQRWCHCRRGERLGDGDRLLVGVDAATADASAIMLLGLGLLLI